MVRCHYILYIVMPILLVTHDCFAYTFYFFNKTNSDIEITARANRCPSSGPITIKSHSDNKATPLNCSNECIEWHITAKKLDTTGASLTFSQPFYGNENYYWAVLDAENKQIKVEILSPINKVTKTGVAQTTSVVEFTEDEIQRKLNQLH